MYAVVLETCNIRNVIISALILFFWGELKIEVGEGEGEGEVNVCKWGRKWAKYVKSYQKGVDARQDNILPVYLNLRVVI